MEYTLRIGSIPKLGRIPLPKKVSGPQTSPKGKKGYNRKREKSVENT